MIVVVVLVGFGVLAVFGGLHWYLWRRLVRDTTAPRTAPRRSGTAVLVAGPLLLLGASVGDSAGLPFPLVRVIAWPGYLWGALVVYLLLALLVGEALRPLLLRWCARENDMDARTSIEKHTESASEPQTSVERCAARVETPPIPATSDLESTEVATSTAHAVRESTAASTPAHPVLEPTAPSTPVREGRELTDVPNTPKEAGEHADLEAQSITATPKPISRRIFVSRAVAGTAALTAAATVGAGTYGVLNGPQVKRLTVPLAKLPRSAHGFRIAVVSDVHLGPILGRGFAERVVRTINDTQPDLIAVVGDLVDGSVDDLRPAVEPLSRLRARHGAYFVTGNHEYFSGAEEWIEHVQDLGLRLLANDRTELPGFDLAGVNDVQGERVGQGPDFGKALGDRDPARTAVLLAHQPIQIHDAVTHGVDLQLSGHTHGGQLWPGNLVAALANPTVAGLERYGDTQLYVTRGAGAWGPPVRVGAPSDITVVELAAARA
ncbi:metallophosphoesterase [Nocardia xishanensis]|uniref:metallophosphoesterase n=1 Tax=Nocardia xishanensis TaxID=238964 RepID=UPI00082D9560|nr:metallophosphoesterase [Nocardia xishanensis]